ncbi:MAG: hypothetical protein ACYTFA_03970 [Planctomycetota bacterium]|jgi:hypothetical protein
MTRRYNGHMNGEQYLGNTAKKEVHDLDSEKTNCQIDEIIRSGHDHPFRTLSEARSAAYDNCHWCLGDSQR